MTRYIANGAGRIQHFKNRRAAVDFVRRMASKHHEGGYIVRKCPFRAVI